MQQIRGFCNVVIFDGLSNAAAKMGLTQSAISHQISSLEETLKLKLFKRIGNKMVLTEDGKRFYDYVIPTFKQLEGIYDRFLIENDETKENELRIGAYHYAASIILPNVLKLIIQNHPEVPVSIEIMHRDEAIKKLRALELDLIIFPFYKENQFYEDNAILSILARRFFKNTLIVHKDNPLSKKQGLITIDDLEYQNILVTDENIAKELMKLRYKKPLIEFINTDWQIIKSFVRINMGITFYTDAEVEYDLRNDLVNIDASHLFDPVEYRICALNIQLKQSIQVFMKCYQQCL
ncbi:MAG: hypothetical protein RL208_466 [Pseudomonadota bacterium]|jgi:DNA-binding transcriptional LysR family regulator